MGSSAVLFCCIFSILFFGLFAIFMFSPRILLLLFIICGAAPSTHTSRKNFRCMQHLFFGCISCNYRISTRAEGVPLVLLLSVSLPGFNFIHNLFIIIMQHEGVGGVPSVCKCPSPNLDALQTLIRNRNQNRVLLKPVIGVMMQIMVINNCKTIKPLSN